MAVVSEAWRTAEVRAESSERERTSTVIASCEADSFSSTELPIEIGRIFAGAMSELNTRRGARLEI